MGQAPSLPSAILSQLVTSQSRVIGSKLNRAQLYSQTFTRTFDGLGYPAIVLPDYPVTAIISVQQGSSLIPPAPLGIPNAPYPAGSVPCYGYRYIPWNNALPGAPTTLELVNAAFYSAPQNVKVTYVAGYLVNGEQWTVPTSPGPYTITTLQPQGIWCRDNGVFYANSGVALTPVPSNPSQGQYSLSSDANPGVYTFAAADAGAAVNISYSFVPADLEEAVIQMVVERYSYRGRVGDISKSLGGQETIRYMRGNSGRPWNTSSSLPPEVMDMIQPYISVLPPTIGSPL